jgi:hypothetical protein
MGAGSQVLKVRVPADATRSFYRMGRKDAIGDAWWAPIESLKDARVKIIGQASREAIRK